MGLQAFHGSSFGCTVPLWLQQKGVSDIFMFSRGAYGAAARYSRREHDDSCWTVHPGKCGGHGGGFVDGGKVLELMATRAKGRPEIVTYVWAVCLVGGLIASITVGPLADRGWISKLCWVAFAFALQGIMPPLLGWIPETKIKGSCVKLHKDKLLEHRHMFALAASMSLIATGLVMVTFFSNYIGKLSYSLLGAAFLTILSFRVLPKTLACCNCYLFLQDTLSFSLSGALEYFFTADEECLPGGPKFSYMFFFTCMHPRAPRILSNAHPRIRVGARVRHLRTHRHWFIPVETQNFQSPSHFRAYDSSKNFRCPI